MDFPTLETDRLLLREIVIEDAPSLLAIHLDLEHMKWFGIDPFPNLEAAEARIRKFADARLQPSPSTAWGITTKSGHQFIGTCGLFGWNKAWRKVALGYELLKESQGNGYMHEALTGVLTWGFRDMGINRFEAQVHPLNVSSIRSLHRLGFVEEGRLRQIGYWANQYHDMLQYSLLRTDWNGLIARRCT